MSKSVQYLSPVTRRFVWKDSHNIVRSVEFEAGVYATSDPDEIAMLDTRFRRVEGMSLPTPPAPSVSVSSGLTTATAVAVPKKPGRTSKKP